MEKKVSTRVYYLDWLRVLGILAVFIYHSSRFFNMEDFMVKNPTWYPGVEVWNRFATAWLMPLMFIVSGASLFYALGKGAGGLEAAAAFVKDKALAQGSRLGRAVQTRRPVCLAWGRLCAGAACDLAGGTL